MHRRAAFQLLLLVAAPTGLGAQATVHPGTTLHVLGGTTVRLPDGVSMTMAPGASMINDGLIHLAPTAVLTEAPGSPVTGVGLERIDLLVSAPPTALEPGGLGLTITAVEALDSLTMLRGHTVRNDTSGATGVARWYSVRPHVNTGLIAEVGFRYDLTELQGIGEADLMLFTARQGDTIWQGVPSVVDLPLTTVFASFLDSLGTYTLFDGSLGTATPDEAPPTSLHAGPNPARDVLDVRDEAGGFRDLTVIDAIGRTVLRIDLGRRATHHRITVSSLASGTYLLRTEDGRNIRFNRP
ncbi:MAG: T9SS type A sorting domain-containing protein [Flavobacteriales bacterium]|nr:T9SS type A sorting domain-containing protein [Flavobacteriales bacterium]